MQSDGAEKMETQVHNGMSDNPPSKLEEQTPVEEITFPEGGARAWAVAVANGGVTFCTLGYINSFG